MKVLVRALDCAAFFFLFLWLTGLVLKHGADPRRAGLLIGLGLVGIPQLRVHSWVALGVDWMVFQLEASRRIRWGVLGAACLWATALGVLQALSLRFPLWDVGIYHQVIWNISQGNGFGSSLSGAGDYLHDHLSVSYLALVPAFLVTGSAAWILPFIHPLCVFGGVAAWLWLAEKISDSTVVRKSWLPAAVVVFGIGFDSLWANFRWGFHESALDFLGLSWMFALIFSAGLSRPGQPPVQRWQGRAVFIAALCWGLFAAGCKEILLVDVALAFLVWSATVYARGRWIRSGFLMGLSIALFSGFVYFEQMPHPAGKNYFDRYYSYLGHGLPEFAANLVTQPWIVVQNVGALNLLKYVLVVFLPWLFLPFFSRNRIWMLSLAPSFFSAALATYPPLRQASFHYVLELWPILAMLTIMTLAVRNSRRLAWSWAFFALVSMDQDPWGQMREYAADTIRAAPVRAAIATIDPALSLMADEMAGPSVANRALLSRWPDRAPFGGACPERVLLPLGARTLEQFPDSATVVRDCRYEQEWKVGDWALLRRA